MLCISFLTTLSPAEYTMTMSLSHSPQFQCSFSSFIAKFSTSGKADVLLAIDNGMFIIVLMQLIYIYHEYSRLPDCSQFFYCTCRTHLTLSIYISYADIIDIINVITLIMSPRIYGRFIITYESKDNSSRRNQSY